VNVIVLLNCFCLTEVSYVFTVMYVLISCVALFAVPSNLKPQLFPFQGAAMVTSCWIEPGSLWALRIYFAAPLLSVFGHHYFLVRFAANHFDYFVRQDSVKQKVVNFERFLLPASPFLTSCFLRHL